MVDFDINEWLRDNEALLIKIAMQANSAAFGMSLEELVQEYREVCWHASEKFDMTRGFCFSTYAVKAMLNKNRQLKRHDCSNQNQVEKHAVRIDKVLDGDESLEELLPAKDVPLDEQTAYSEIRTVVERELLRMGGRNRNIVLKLLRGYSQAFVAKYYGISQPTVAAVMKAFRSSLKLALMEAGYWPEGAA